MNKNRLLLGVNIDHVATLRQARGVDYPDPLAAARVCREAGAAQVTVHLREDRRHIQDADVFRIRKANLLPMNLEMANAPEIVRIALNVRPAEACLVPERRREVTTEGGLDVAAQRRALRPTIRALQAEGVAVSLFIGPEPDQVAAAADVGARVVELHTGAYCNATRARQPRELAALRRGAQLAHDLGMQVNAGHGINLDNLAGVLTLPWLHTLNIGHSLVARAVFVGLGRAIREMRAGMQAYRGGRPDRARK